MSAGRDDEDRPALPVCACIRTKMQYVAGPGGDGWGRTSATAQYWCLHTMLQIGPDDDLVTPDRCLPDRACFERED
jgi:hypothetical protein